MTPNELRSKVDIIAIVQQYVKLQRRGTSWWSKCPLHPNERTPSFHVDPAKQVWHCFSCGKGGSVFDFIMAVEGFQFVSAMKRAAELAGLTLDMDHVTPEAQAEDRQHRAEQKRLREEAELWRVIERPAHMWIYADPPTLPALVGAYQAFCQEHPTYRYWLRQWMRMAETITGRILNDLSAGNMPAIAGLDLW